MKKHFLGKNIPQAHVSHEPKKSKTNLSWTLLFSAPIVIFLGLSLIAPASLHANGNTTPTLERDVAAAVTQTRTLGAAAAVDPCDWAIIGPQVQNSSLFPFISPILTKKDGCNPTYWNREIIAHFVQKSLGILNYFVGALAIIATIYGGVLYITGFQSEANVKKAKTVIIGTYTGFIIVLLARFLIQGAFFFFGTGSIDFSKGF